jgi:sulfhydrogenase subunit gamma (sulfur reductase)
MCEYCGGNSKKDIYLPEMATVKQTRMMNGTELYMKLVLDSGEELQYKPGQFLEVSVAGLGEAPISITSSPTQKEGFELVIRNAGNVTKAIHKMKPGAKVGIRGPYGHGYPYKDMMGRNLIFICGGIGLVPQRSFINYVLHNRSDYGEVTILQGVKCQLQRFFREELARWSHRNDIHFIETVDEQEDCWNGNVGVVTTLIPKIETELTNADIFICGPPVMYKFVLFALNEANVSPERIWVNLERRMKCGVGKCGHCQINNVYVCQSGPVFKWSDLALVPEAI